MSKPDLPTIDVQVDTQEAIEAIWAHGDSSKWMELWPSAMAQEAVAIGMYWAGIQDAVETLHALALRNAATPGGTGL